MQQWKLKIMYGYFIGTVHEFFKILQQIPVGLQIHIIQVSCKISPDIGCTTVLPLFSLFPNIIPGLSLLQGLKQVQVVQMYSVHPIWCDILHETYIISIPLPCIFLLFSLYVYRERKILFLLPMYLYHLLNKVENIKFKCVYLSF